MWPNVSSTFADTLRESSSNFPPVLSGQEDTVEALETMVKQALRAQSDWSEAVTEQIVSTPGMPEGFAALTRQIHTVTDGLYQYQTEFWNSWFRMVRGAGDSVAVVAPPVAEIVAVETVVPAAVAPAPVAEVEAVLEETAPLVEDDLRAISGIGPVLAGKLQADGVTSFRQIAGWSDEDITRIEAAIIPARFHGRISRDDWTGQARDLHAAKYGEQL